MTSWSMQEDKGTCTKSHLTVYLQTTLQQATIPLSVEQEKENIKGGREGTKKRELEFQQKAINCNRRKKLVVYTSLCATTLKANKDTHTEGGGTLGLPSIGQENHPSNKKLCPNTFILSLFSSKFTNLILVVGPSQQSVTHNFHQNFIKKSNLKVGLLKN